MTARWLIPIMGLTFFVGPAVAADGGTEATPAPAAAPARTPLCSLFGAERRACGPVAQLEHVLPGPRDHVRAE